MQYRVLGVEGEKVTVNGTEYDALQDAHIELTEEEAAEALAAGTIELVSDVEESEEEESEEDEEDEGEVM